VTALGQRHLDGIGRQAGPLRPDYGPDWAELACDQCSATWVGRIGDPCDWCEKALERMRQWAGEDALRPPEVDPDDIRYDARMAAWAGRLRRAVSVGLILEADAVAALRKAAA
jgi:hypothetical protein